MKLEAAIKQGKPFKCPYEKALVNLIYTKSWIDQEMGQFFKSIEVTGKQYNILRILKGADAPVSNAYIRERLLDKLSDVSRIIERMEKKKLVHKAASKSDRRLVELSLTPKGLEILEEAESMKGKRNKVLNNLSVADVKKLNLLLDKLRNKN